jgi:hypothetical protein
MTYPTLLYDIYIYMGHKKNLNVIKIQRAEVKFFIKYEIM